MDQIYQSSLQEADDCALDACADEMKTQLEESRRRFFNILH